MALSGKGQHGTQRERSTCHSAGKVNIYEPIKILTALTSGGHSVYVTTWLHVSGSPCTGRVRYILLKHEHLTEMGIFPFLWDRTLKISKNVSFIYCNMTWPALIKCIGLIVKTFQIIKSHATVKGLFYIRTLRLRTRYVCTEYIHFGYHQMQWNASKNNVHSFFVEISEITVDLLCTCIYISIYCSCRFRNQTKIKAGLRDMVAHW
jgi:hypothetical protein